MVFGIVKPTQRANLASKLCKVIPLPADMVSEQSSEKTSLRVLVVDDEGLIATTLAEILRLNAYSAEAVHNGLDAIARAKSDPFDVLISDVVMPGMNGIEAAEAICSILPKCRVILISGNSETAHLLAEANARGREYEIHAKPVHPGVLLGLLRDVQEQHDRFGAN